jgi:hypothetical protein
MTATAEARAFDSDLYGRWIVANGWSELVGLGATGLLGWWVVGAAGEPSSPLAVVGMALLAVVGGTVFEGVLVGLAQAQVLKLRLPALSVRRWIIATAEGAGVAWLLGVIPSTVMGLADHAQAAGTAPAWLAGPLQYALAAGMGLVLGPVLACPQSFVLRAYTGRPLRWIRANAIAWAVGMPLIFLGAGSIPPRAGPLEAIAIVAATCLATGLVVGAVHGWVLVRLVESSPSS